MSDAQRAAQALQLANTLWSWMPRDKAISGAALAQMLAFWLLSHAKEEREETLEQHIEGMRRMLSSLQLAVEAKQNREPSDE